MRTVSEAEYLESTQGSTVLSRNDDGGMTIRCADGGFIKVFRRPGLFSSARLRSLAVRYCAAAKELARRGVPTVQVIGAFRIVPGGRHAVRYQGLKGNSLRAGIDARPSTPKGGGDLLRGFARFIAEMHAKGIYFRGLHFDNVVVEGERFGLIDVGAARFRRGPLPSRLRARNFRHMLRYDADRAALEAFGLAEFLRQYLSAAGLDDAPKRRFLRCLRAQHASLPVVVDELVDDRS